MKDAADLSFMKRLGDLGEIAGVALQELDGAERAQPRKVLLTADAGEIVEDQHLFAAAQKCGGDVAADKAATPGH